MIRDLLDRRIAGERLTRDDLLRLYRKADVMELGAAAHEIRQRMHDPGTCTFVKDLNLNYTNACVVKCKFCAFYREPGHDDVYVREPEEILERVEQLANLGGTQVLIQGGLNPDLEFDYYLELLSEIKRRYPVDLHSFTATEIDFFKRVYGFDTHKGVLRELRDAGLDSLPGGGAEILTDRVREEISPLKNEADTWLSVLRAAQELGMPTTATMMYGSVDTPEDRIDHLLRIRDLQDETGGFSAFIPWSFQGENTELKDERPDLEENTAYDYLKMVAMGRLALDNVPHLQAGWVTEGKKVGQMALHFGADDWGGILMEENVVREAGATYRTTVEESLRYIREAGYTPVQRNTYYLPVRTYEDDYEVRREAERSTPIMQGMELPVVN